jgi:LacI family transcriptional regulator
MHDVATLAGVSVATVSRALNAVATVDPTLVERVRAAAAELGYRTNGVARSLRRQRSDVWALIVSDIGNPFFTLVARGVEDVAQQAGFSVVLCNSDEDPSKEARYLDVAERERVSGVIMSPNIFGSDISRLIAANIPVVAIDRPLREPVDSVLVRLREGARAATTHLLDAGWTMPACLTGPRPVDTAQQRLAGYRDALRERGRRLPAAFGAYGDFQAQSAREVIASLLDRRVPPDAFVIANSAMTLGALEVLGERGMLPGRDVGIVAFHSGPWARFLNPPLSVVAQPTYEIGRRAAELLLQRMSFRPTPGRRVNDHPITVMLSTELTIRASSQRTSESKLSVI